MPAPSGDENVVRALADLLICLRFFTRLPLPTTRREGELGAGGLAAAAGMVPLAGAIVGLVPALTALFGVTVGLPPAVVALLALATLVLFTGALHEDALADCADGFGGGRTRARKLAIMRDSRIGAFGACAIILSLMIRAAALDALITRQSELAATALVITACLSRTACLVPLHRLPPARADGLGAAASRPTTLNVIVAAIIAIAIALALTAIGSPGLSYSRTAAAIGLAALSAAFMSGLAQRQIGGQTGDVVGATQQAAECVVLIVMTAAP